MESLLGSIANLNLSKIDWVIVGGESGPKGKTNSESPYYNLVKMTA